MIDSIAQHDRLILINCLYSVYRVDEVILSVLMSGTIYLMTTLDDCLFRYEIIDYCHRKLVTNVPYISAN